MNKLARTLTTVAASAALLGISACAGGGGSEGEAPDPQAGGGAALDSFDPCTFFKPEQLSSWGLPPVEGKKADTVSFEPGCEWDGEEALLTLQKNVEETVESYETSGSWDSYDKTTVAGRPAAVALEPGATGQGSCTVLVDAGGGVAIYMLDGLMRDSLDDPCGETKKIASESAAELPK